MIHCKVFISRHIQFILEKWIELITIEFTLFIGELVTNIALVECDRKWNDGPYEKGDLHDSHGPFSALRKS